MSSMSKSFVLAAAGCTWIGLVLVSLIVSGVAFQAFREFIVSLGIVPYLGLWALALVPGILLVIFSGALREA